MLTVRFWGVRGSLPTPGRETAVFGGNTSCLEIRAIPSAGRTAGKNQAKERLIIIDLGSGVRPLGDWLIKNDLKKFGKIKADIFITHTHWDHVMGFPMFNPIYKPGTELTITGPVSMDNEDIKSILEYQFLHKYWPVRATDLAANIEYRQIKEETVNLGDGLIIKSKFLNHPINCLGYRIYFEDKSIATVFDHEPFHDIPAADSQKTNLHEKIKKEKTKVKGKIAADTENEKIRKFIKDADMVIHDAQYMKDEYNFHLGWGHCSYDHAIQSTINNGIKKAVLFHHDPTRTDSQLKKLEKIHANSKDPLIVLAKEGMLLEA